MCSSGAFFYHQNPANPQKGRERPPSSLHAQANEEVGVPGRADVPVGMANGKANEKAVNDPPLALHAQANEDVGVPGRAVSSTTREFFGAGRAARFVTVALQEDFQKLEIRKIGSIRGAKIFVVLGRSGRAD